MAKASANQFPYVTFAESAAPSTPASGLALAYVKTDGKLYLKDDAGTESDLTVALPASSSTWTPTITQSGSVSCTVTAARYHQIGAITFFYFYLVVTGSGTTANPISIGGQPAALQSAYTGVYTGTGAILDNGTGQRQNNILINGATDWQFIRYNDYVAEGTTGANAAWALANGDNIWGHGFVLTA